jgi:hypothetical protein
VDPYSGQPIMSNIPVMSAPRWPRRQRRVMAVDDDAPYPNPLGAPRGPTTVDPQQRR